MIQKPHNHDVSGQGERKVPAGWLECPHCEASCRDADLPPYSELRCSRCGERVKAEHDSYSFQPALALTTAGILSLILANMNPVLTFDVAGASQSGFIITGIEELFRQGYWPIAILVCFAGVVGPALSISSKWYVVAACCFRVRLPFVKEVFDCISLLRPWNLIPVYAIATVVAVVKLKMMGAVFWGFGARWILVLAACSLLGMQYFDHEFVRKRLKDLE